MTESTTTFPGRIGPFPEILPKARVTSYLSNPVPLPVLTLPLKHLSSLQQRRGVVFVLFCCKRVVQEVRILTWRVSVVVCCCRSYYCYNCPRINCSLCVTTSPFVSTFPLTYAHSYAWTEKYVSIVGLFSVVVPSFYNLLYWLLARDIHASWSLCIRDEGFLP